MIKIKWMEKKIMEEKDKKGLCNLKLHLVALVIVIICELIGTKAINTPIGAIVLLPLIYAIAFGIIAGLPKVKIVSLEDQDDANTMLSIAVLVLLAKVGTTAGPTFFEIIHSGLALVLQEFGNVGTALLAIPVGVALGLKREVVGGAHSISRDTNLALVSEIYGMDSPEGRGVLGVYLYGSLFGTIIVGVLTSIVASWGIFSVEALAMATGVGSTGFTAAGTASLINLFPQCEQSILAYSAASSLLTGFDAVYISLFIGLPLSRWIYKISYRIKYKTEPDKEIRKGMSE